MAWTPFQQTHDALVAVTIAAQELTTFLRADCPEVEKRIADLIMHNELAGDPIAKLSKATEAASEIARKMERLP